MIANDEELEAALEAVSRWLEHPPEPNSAEEECFNQLLGDIEMYRPSLEAPAPHDPDAERREALRQRADELTRSWAENRTSLMDVVDGAVNAFTGRPS